MTMTVAEPAAQTDTAHVCVIDGQRDVGRRGHACTACEVLLADQLLELSHLGRLLTHATVPARGQEQRLPIRLDIVDLSLPANTRPIAVDLLRGAGLVEDQIGRTPLASMLGTWVRDFADQGAPITAWPLPGRQPDIGDIALWLWVRVEWACRWNPAVDEFASEVRAALSAARYALNVARRPIRYATPCPRCSGTLTKWPGQPTAKGRPERGGWIECDGCGRMFDDDEYRRIVAASVPGWWLLTAAQASVVTRIPADRIRKWAERGRIVPVIGPWGGKRVYELDDVRRLAGVAIETLAERMPS